MAEGSFALLSASVATLAVLTTYGDAIRRVGEGRRVHGVKPPSTEGPEAFTRLLRAQQNVLEFLPLVIPLLWASALTLPVVGGVVTLAAGLAWAWYRKSYIEGYAEAAEKRLPGFYGSMVALNVLVGSTVLGCLYRLADILE